MIAKDKKTHTIGEILIKPAAIAISQIINGDKVTAEIIEMPLSTDNICRRISKTGQDIMCQLIDE